MGASDDNSRYLTDMRSVVSDIGLPRRTIGVMSADPGKPIIAITPFVDIGGYTQPDREWPEIITYSSPRDPNQYRDMQMLPDGTKRAKAWRDSWSAISRSIWSKAKCSISRSRCPGNMPPFAVAVGQTRLSDDSKPGNSRHSVRISKEHSRPVSATADFEKRSSDRTRRRKRSGCSMILHDFPFSSASYRVRIVLNLKGLAYEKRNYALRAGEQRAPAYLDVNPAGFVPTLEVDGLRIGQSLAITDYLDAVHPDPRMIPTDPIARARAMEMALTIACDIHPMNNLRVLQYLQHAMGRDKAAVDDWYRHWIEQGFVTLEQLLPDTPFAGGDAPNVVDACLVPQVYNARRFKVDLTPFSRLTAMADRAAALPAFLAAAPPQP